MLPTMGVFIGVAIMMLLLGTDMLRKQARAKSCPAHSKIAGSLATLIAWMLIASSAGLLAYAAVLIAGY